MPSSSGRGGGKKAERGLPVLCLHGHMQTAEVFKGRIDSLRKKARGTIDLIFLDGPFALPLKDGEEVPMRSWRDGGGGFDASVAKAEECITRHGIRGIIGFSQGGTLAALLAARSTTIHYVIIAGAPDDEAVCDVAAHVRSLHVYGMGDAAVPPTLSLLLQRKFSRPVALQHDQVRAPAWTCVRA